MLVCVLLAVAFLLTVYLQVDYDEEADFLEESEKEIINDSQGIFASLWALITNDCLLPAVQNIVSFMYFIYARLSLINMINFLVKYVAAGLYTCKFLKNFYTLSRERIQEKQTELEDLQLQMEIVSTKLSVREAEFEERSEALRKSCVRLRDVRSRVRRLLATDDLLRQAVDANVADLPAKDDCPPDYDREPIVALLKELEDEEVKIPERFREAMDCGEPQNNEYALAERDASENSVYSCMSDVDVKDCQVKIVKVTNMYKVAYLKHYIKQKRIRRVTKQAMLKKKIENIRQLLEDWNKKLDMVVNNKQFINSIEVNRVEAVSQEAMGDYSKPSLRESSDSDSDLRPEDYYDEYAHGWANAPYRCTYNNGDVAENRDYIELDYLFKNPNQQCLRPCECTRMVESKLFALPEETTSQVAIEEICETGNLITV